MCNDSSCEKETCHLIRWQGSSNLKLTETPALSLPPPRYRNICDKTMAWEEGEWMIKSNLISWKKAFLLFWLLLWSHCTFCKLLSFHRNHIKIKFYLLCIASLFLPSYISHDVVEYWVKHKFKVRHTLQVRLRTSSCTHTHYTLHLHHGEVVIWSVTLLESQKFIHSLLKQVDKQQ